MYIPIQMDDCWILQSGHLVKGFFCLCGWAMLMMMDVRSARVKRLFGDSGCVMLMAHPVVMMLAMRSSEKKKKIYY